MRSRILSRLYTAVHAAPTFATRRRAPRVVKRLLIAHYLMLGDTIMLTPLLKKARRRFPDAEIVMTVPSAYAPLYRGQPYGVRALPFDQRSLGDHMSMRDEVGFDLALVPGDNRWSWLARMLRARWVVAFASDQRTYKDVPVDEFVPLPRDPLTWSDMAARLLEGDEVPPYQPGEWPAPPFKPYPSPRRPYCVMHLGASTPHKHWPPERWKVVVEWAEKEGYGVVLSIGPGEERLAAAVDEHGGRSALAGKLDLAQLWDLLRNASFLVCPDTGVAHMARLVRVPTVAIYGPGSPVSSGLGAFWEGVPLRALWDPDVACRDQDLLFDRKVTWLRHCWRGVAECGDPVCVRRVTTEQVIAGVRSLLQAR